MAYLDRIKFDDPTSREVVWKHPSERIPFGSQLVVSQGQHAILVKGGRIADVFGPGTYSLTSKNLPLLQKLVNAPFGGKTPFTCEVWYVSSLAKMGLKWGTRGAIQVLDPVYNFPVGLRSFGQWGFRICDAQPFLAQLTGTLAQVDSTTVEDYFAAEIVQRYTSVLSSAVASWKASVFDISARLNQLSESCATSMAPDLSRFGIELMQFNIERISISQEEHARIQSILGKRLEIEQLSSARMSDTYRTIRGMDIEEAAARNPRGVAMPIFFTQPEPGVKGDGKSQIPPTPDSANRDHPTTNPTPEPLGAAHRLQQLGQLLAGGLISEEEFRDKRREILKDL